METAPLMKLDLRSPLLYAKTADLSPDLPRNMAEDTEILLCFDLNPSQSRSIEPEPGQLLGQMVFSGQKSAVLGDFQAEEAVLPAGMYLFTQCRGGGSFLSMEEWLNLAVEQQKDGLWERHRPESKLYVRFLFEDGGFVTQLFRPLAG
jgi:hypothetical protein